MKINELLEDSQGIPAYRPDPPVVELAEDLGYRVEDILKLNSNENLFLPRSLIQDIVSEVLIETDPRLYPQSEVAELNQLIAGKNDVKPSQVVVSAGGDQLIEVLYSLFRRGDRVTAVSPTFSMYPRVALQRGVQLKEAPLRNDFTLDVRATLECAVGASLLVVCNPNNPTGNQFPREELLELITGFDGFVLVDEAYQEYSDYSLVGFTEEYDNLLVLRTFSKAYGLAGLRLGYCITNTRLASMIRDRYMMPYPVSNLVLATGIKVLGKEELVMEAISETKRLREWLVAELNSMDGVEAFPSSANFVLFNTLKPLEVVYSGLMSRGVILRKQGRILGRENCLRVTIAPKPMLERFLVALKEATL